MTTKKKEKKNADFKKVKLKVGKKLKKTTTTDATIQAKRIVISSQLGEKAETEEKPLSFRGLSLDELCNQLGHFNKNIRKDALIGTKQLLSYRPDLISAHLRTLIPSVARLLNESATDFTLNSHLKALLTLICSVKEQTMNAHFTLLMAHTLHALTNMEIRTRVLALSVLSILLNNYPRLCRNSSDLFSAFVKFLASPRKPSWNYPKFLDIILIFLSIYDKPQTGICVHSVETVLSMERCHLSCPVNLLDSIDRQNEGPFDFSVYSKDGSAAASPFELPENLIVLSDVLAPIIAAVLVEDNGGTFLNNALAIIDAIGRATIKQTNSFLIPDFRKRLSQSWIFVRKAALSRKNERIRQAVVWMCE